MRRSSCIAKLQEIVMISFWRNFDLMKVGRLTSCRCSSSDRSRTAGKPTTGRPRIVWACRATIVRDGRSMSPRNSSWIERRRDCGQILRSGSISRVSCVNYHDEMTIFLGSRTPPGINCPKMTVPSGRVVRVSPVGRGGYNRRVSYTQALR